MAKYKLTVGESDNKQCLFLAKDENQEHPIPYSIIKGVEIKDQKISKGKLVFTIELTGELEQKLKKALAKKPPKKEPVIVIPTQEDVVDLTADFSGEIIDLTSSIDLESTTIRQGRTTQRIGAKPGQRPARSEPLQIDKNRPNNFLKLKNITIEKPPGYNELDDSFFTPREKPEKSSVKRYKIRCSSCGGVFVISESELPPSIAGEMCQFRCDNCCGNNGGIR